MTAILGISAYDHDSAAALVVDGDIVAAAQEERFSRKKHDVAFPEGAARYCLDAAGITADRLDYVVFYEKPWRRLGRLLETSIAYAPRGFASFSEAVPLWIKDRIELGRSMRRTLGKGTSVSRIFADHHESHAASAFFPSPFDEAAILTLDGVGEWSTTTLGAGAGNRIHLTDHIAFPHSLGLLYSAFTYYCGFKVNSGEPTLMGLAPYGRPVFAEAIREHLIDLKADGSFRLNLEYFTYCEGPTLTGPRFDELFQGPPREAGSPLTERYCDLAASIQAVTEEAVLRIGRELHRRTKHSNLVMAGAVALNCVANGRLLREGPFERIWVQPAADDAGGALGAALFVWHQVLDNPRPPRADDSQHGSLLGPSASTAAIQALVDREAVPSIAFGDEDSLLDFVSGLLAAGKVVGWFQGRMEFGPRALGARSILADPRPATLQARMNLDIKSREGFSPFAPAVLDTHAAAWFEVDPSFTSPYMVVVAPVREEHRTAGPPETRAALDSEPDPSQRGNVPRSTVPAVTHVDYSARLQTVDRTRNPRFYRLIERFAEKTGCPMLVNASFSVRDEPIVCTAEDAYRCFDATGMDALVLERHVLLKEELTGRPVVFSDEKHLAQYQLD